MTDDEQKKRTVGRRESDTRRYALIENRIRDAVIFVIGIGGVVNELFVLDDPRPSALVFLASLIGVPFVLSADERRAAEGGGKGGGDGGG